MLFNKRVVRTKLNISVFNSAHGTFLEDLTLIRYIHLLESQSHVRRWLMVDVAIQPMNNDSLIMNGYELF
jgi:hypothetical protein